MSSNTLRGIGQEEGGDDAVVVVAGKGEGSAASTASSAANGGVKAGHAAAGGRQAGAAPSADRTEPTQDLRNIASLDATVPGTRSLDASVPEARPSLDGKVPAMAATLLGVVAPVVATGSRDKGTVQGRDVHLPVEAQRLAGVRAVADAVAAPDSEANISVEAAPHAIDRSEPTIADPVITAALAQVSGGAGPAGEVRGHAPAADSISHGPWYEQDPTGGHEVYEDRKPNVLGRAAIGVAVAAGLSVLVFGVIRLGAANGDDSESKPRAAGYGLPPEPGHAPATATPGQAASAEAPPAAVGMPQERTATTANELPRSKDDLADAPSASPLGSLGVPPARAKATPVVRPAGTKSAGVGRVPARAGATTIAGHVAGSQPALSNELAPAALAATATTPPPLARTTDAPAATSAPPPGKPGPTEKARGKANYDPDSTLPLNLE